VHRTAAIRITVVASRRRDSAGLGMLPKPAAVTHARLGRPGGTGESYITAAHAFQAIVLDATGLSLLDFGRPRPRSRRPATPRTRPRTATSRGSGHPQLHGQGFAVTPGSTSLTT
jgi:hypothetical protein